MIRIAIVEDDPDYTAQLREYLKRYKLESGNTLEVTHFTDGDEIAENYKPRFDIILMDIAMRFKDGMTAAREIRRTDPEVIIIFITSMVQYAIEGYEVDAAGYLLKPVSYFAFSQRLNRAVRRLKSSEPQYVIVPVRGGTRRQEVSQIYYVESRNHELTFHTVTGDFNASLTMRQAEERLADRHFFRGNNSFLINLIHVDGVQDGCAMVHGQKLQLSRPRRNAFLEALADYIGEAVQ